MSQNKALRLGPRDLNRNAFLFLPFFFCFAPSTKSHSNGGAGVPGKSTRDPGVDYLQAQLSFIYLAAQDPL
ncbi:hypothetical protein F4778DRAFT_724774 [Xylariomycetidae sp. FL2044]|nr:hypothetical protein F4778DRAFT_724774 [Xylariomycetidae sp. FL2044]